MDCKQWANSTARIGQQLAVALNMEDEEIAESWEEAADSGVRSNDMSRINLLLNVSNLQGFMIHAHLFIDWLIYC